jgi:RimJ/RimL family protein N-acetyltransferase
MKKLQRFPILDSDAQTQLAYFPSIVRDNSIHELGVGTMHNMKSVVAGVLLPDNQQTEIGFTTSPEHQRKRYAFEAVAAVIGYLFKLMGKHRIIGSADPMNAVSIALLEKLGMRREGYFKRSIMIRNQWEDDIVYAILNEEWPERYRPR